MLKAMAHDGPTGHGLQLEAEAAGRSYLSRTCSFPR